METRKPIPKFDLAVIAAAACVQIFIMVCAFFQISTFLRNIHW